MNRNLASLILVGLSIWAPAFAAAQTSDAPDKPIRLRLFVDDRERDLASAEVEFR